MATKRKSSMPVSKATTAYELLDEIRELILEEPKRYDQHEIRYLEEEGDEPPRGFPQCGTVGCVAGWVVVLKGDWSSMDVWAQAKHILGLKDLQDDELFDAYAAGDTGTQTAAHARAGAAHIRRFMLANKAQLKARKV